MADKDQNGTIPSWDGQAKTWRRYTKEVAWFVSSTAVQKRRYVASKLISKLQGPARLLAMSWNLSEFDSPQGTLILLKKLSVSPLLRKTLPNTAAILQQYLGFRRRPGEGMATFLVREALGYEEFTEALARLWEEQHGIDPAEWNFGLPPAADWDDYAWWGDYGDLSASGDPHDQVPGDPNVQPDAEQVHGADGNEQAAETSAPAGANVRGSSGSSPSHRGGQFDQRSTRSSARFVDRSVQPSMVDELSLADSFIMKVLRGWRLLQAATLTPEETRDILSTTQNKLDFEAISQALQSLWDAQLLGQRYGASAHRDNWHHANWHEWDEDDGGWDEWDPSCVDWSSDDWRGEGQWHEDWQDYESYDAAAGETSVVATEDDEQVREALAAEKGC